MLFFKIIINNCILYYKKYYICTIKEKQLNKNIMTTFNKTITIEEATELINSTNASYLPTPHNMKMVKLALDNFLNTLR